MYIFINYIYLNYIIFLFFKRIKLTLRYVEKVFNIMLGLVYSLLIKQINVYFITLTDTNI